MARFNKVSAELLDELKQVLGEKGVTVDPENCRRIRPMKKAIPIGSVLPK